MIGFAKPQLYISPTVHHMHMQGIYNIHIIIFITYLKFASDKLLLIIKA